LENQLGGGEGGDFFFDGNTMFARFFLVYYTKTGKNAPNEQKMYQRVIEFPKCFYNIANGHKIYQHTPI
jgi:hypothetical protein